MAEVRGGDEERVLAVFGASMPYRSFSEQGPPLTNGERDEDAPPPVTAPNSDPAPVPASPVEATPPSREEPKLAAGPDVAAATAPRPQDQSKASGRRERASPPSRPEFFLQRLAARDSDPVSSHTPLSEVFRTLNNGRTVRPPSDSLQRQLSRL